MVMFTLAKFILVEVGGITIGALELTLVDNVPVD
jgi:hypothetical protein